MFTGLIQAVGTIAAMEPSSRGARLRIETALATELREGDSVGVSGVCLTAVDARQGAFSAQVMNETLERTALGALSAGARVNLELPLRAGDRLGGHIVQGHVDAVGTVAGVSDDGLARLLSVQAPRALLRYVVEKGSIAVDGVSLTVAASDTTSFTVSLIPETLQRTTLGRVEPGDKVNLEVDVLAKYMEKMVRKLS